MVDLAKGFAFDVRAQNPAPHTVLDSRAQILDRDAAKLRLIKLVGEKE